MSEHHFAEARKHLAEARKAAGMGTEEQEIRLAVIREICDREGHGELVETTTRGDLPFRISMCNRGCGAIVVEPPPGATPPLLVTYLERNYAGHTAYFRNDGKVEVRWPTSTSA